MKSLAGATFSLMRGRRCRDAPRYVHLCRWCAAQGSSAWGSGWTGSVAVIVPPEVVAVVAVGYDHIQEWSLACIASVWGHWIGSEAASVGRVQRCLPHRGGG